MTNWIEYNGGPQPVGDDVWVEMHGVAFDEAGALHWNRTVRYRILNQHLIDAKQAEIDALKEDLAIWDSVFPDLLPDRLKSDKQLADEDVAAKIDAARLEGIEQGLKAAAAALQAHDTRPGAWTLIVQAIRALDPETIAKEADNEPR
jgi:hypothetical protein